MNICSICTFVLFPVAFFPFCCLDLYSFKSTMYLLLFASSLIFSLTLFDWLFLFIAWWRRAFFLHFFHVSPSSWFFHFKTVHIFSLSLFEFFGSYGFLCSLHGGDGGGKWKLNSFESFHVPGAHLVDSRVSNI